jgi:ribosomal protein L13
MTPVIYTIDATDRTLGRVCSEAAHALLGKRSVHFAKNQAIPITVTITNAGKLHLPAEQRERFTLATPAIREGFTR